VREIRPLRSMRWDVENGAMAEPLGNRQTKEAATDMPGLPPPRHIPTSTAYSPRSVRRKRGKAPPS